MKQLILVMTLLCAAPILAQQSAGYQLTEHTFNQGGRPQDGLIATSTSFRITLDAIGESGGGAEPTSVSFGVAPGFASAFGPASEAFGLLFDDATTMSWEVEPQAVAYNVYRGETGSLSGLDNGGCLQSSGPGTGYTDPEEPAAAEGFFYLVAASNRLAEEGTLGFDSDGVERGNATPCP